MWSAIGTPRSWHAQRRSRARHHRYPADVGQHDESWAVLADSDGNEFCVPLLSAIECRRLRRYGPGFLAVTYPDA